MSLSDVPNYPTMLIARAEPTSRPPCLSSVITRLDSTALRTHEEIRAERPPLGGVTR